jgi:hypothetical protein
MVMSEAEIETLGPLFTYSEAIEAGLSERRLYGLRDNGVIEAVGRGLYRRTDAPPADLDLIEIAERVPQATLCLETALAHHGLLDVIPLATDIAVPRGAHRPALQAPVRLHSFDPATFEIGREVIDVGGRTPLGIYGPERSIIDMIRLRHNEGSDQAWDALRRWLHQPGHSPARLIELSRSFRHAEPSLRVALEVLL